MSHPSSSVNTPLRRSFLVILVMLCCIRTTRSSHPFRQATAFINSNMSNATHTDKKAKLSTYPMELTSRPAQCNLVPPGVCQFTPTFTSVPLLDRVPAGEGGTSYILRFGLPDGEKSMGLTTCACVLACAELEDREKGEKVPVIRPYTVRLMFLFLIACCFLKHLECLINLMSTYNSPLVQMIKLVRLISL